MAQAEVAKKAEKPLPPQYYFLSRRTFMLRTKEGQCLSFEAGKPTHVPKLLHSLAMEKGLVPCDAAGKELDLVTASEANAASTEEFRPAQAPENADERNAAILRVVKAIVARNDSKDFGGNARPRAEAVSFALGWRVDPKDLNRLWDQHRAEILTGKKQVD
jgi:hypothetical protein